MAYHDEDSFDFSVLLKNDGLITFEETLMVEKILLSETGRSEAIRWLTMNSAFVHSAFRTANQLTDDKDKQTEAALLILIRAFSGVLNLAG